MKQIQWTEKQFKLFKKEYKSAIEKDNNSFFFEGNEFLVVYAKYLIEYLENCTE
jgi:hypothetical protein